jgi:hypothetical protein
MNVMHILTGAAFFLLYLVVVGVVLPRLGVPT